MRKPFRVHRFGHSHVVTIPKAILEQLHWKAGTDVLVETVDGRVVITDVSTRTRELLEANIRASIAKIQRSA